MKKQLKPHRAFTLAEVLITLAIIGIVAALTIPTLVAKNEKKQLYTQFMKTYNTISNALNLAIVDHGDFRAWITDKKEASAYIEKYLFPYVKSAKVCNPLTDCLTPEYKNLEGESMSTAVNGILESNPFGFKFPDGAVVFGDTSGSIIFDTNGSKGPNVFARDLFYVKITLKEDKEYNSPIYVPSSTTEHCLTHKGAEADYCAAKLLSEGAMNY